jgi:hypothetical protein
MYLQNGLIVSYLSLFRGMIDRNSLAEIYSDDEWEAATFDVKIIGARIVHINHENKLVRMSTRPHVLELRPPANLPPLGSLLFLMFVSLLK